MKGVVPDKAVVDFVTKQASLASKPHQQASHEANLFVQLHDPPPILKRTIPTPSYAKGIVSPPKTRLNFYLDQRQQIQTHQPTSIVWTPQSPTTPRPVTVASSPRDKAPLVRKRPVVNVNSREHLEIRACMLSHRYRFNIHELMSVEQDYRQSVAQMRQQRQLSLSPDTTCVQETARRKTQFLLNHFLGLDDTVQPVENDNSQQVLYDVVDEWSLHADASVQEVESLWDSITAHVEKSYVLQTNVMEASMHPLAVQIALDCLGSVASRLPSYSRLLIVLKTILERAALVPTDTTTKAPRELFLDKLAQTQRALEECQAQLAALEAKSRRDPLERIVAIVQGIEDECKRHQLLVSAIGQLLPQSRPGIEVIKAAAAHASIPDQLSVVQSIVKKRSLHEMQPILMAIHTKHKEAMPMFMEDHSDAMEALVLSDGGRGIQKIMEANGPFFADLYLRAPSLLNHAFQAQGPLLGQLVEHHRSTFADYLSQRHDVFLQILLSALKDNNLLALEEYLVKTPKALRDVLLNRPNILSTAVKSSPGIFSDLLMNAKPVFLRVITDVPEHLIAVFTSNPAAVGTIFAASDTLGPVLDNCLQALSNYLEKSSDAIMDIANRKPKLLAQVLTKCPDLLVEPLEANPTIVASMLAANKDLIRAIPLHEIDVGPVRLLKTSIATTQTEGAPMQMQVASGANRLKKRNNVLVQIVKKRKVNPMSEQDVLKEISKLYAKKIAFDEIDDRAGLDRYSLAELTQDVYVQELGLKSTAQKRIASLVAGLKKMDKDNTRAHWFGILLGATAELFNAQAIDVFLHALSFLIPPGEVEARLGDGSQPCLVPLTLAKELAMHVYDSSVSMDMRITLQKRIMALPSIVNVANSDATDVQLLINVDLVMDCVMSLWYEIRSSIDNEMTKLFAGADEDGNGVLTYQEFETMIKKVDANCDDRTIMRIFNMCGEENDQGEHEIKPVRKSRWLVLLTFV
ncbi:hypothetical protein Ae201684P_006856 [Aphanomyces euteiches]|uniref:EF-hand domain-containing protein n=1 Tax=Aphanomyces euteiches TaxID=100861 RepID=A0A6G0X8H3_9STRA|nr:hypothetical protein Ae201684_007387 [Aphanomyces euteiches]KAH9100661.1 hypothetical protein Ae201684P_006856 [Aphanomyces euteiches]KAH9135439.1 hypothetical protein AeRB84_019157 [Aphanomyces euteiches]